MIVIKAPAGFDPTWPALPVDPTCPTCGHSDDPGEMIWPTTGCLTRCDACNGSVVLDLAALLGPKDCAAPMGLTPEGKHWPASWLGGRCCDGSGKVPQRVALAIETPCETCHGTHAIRTHSPDPTVMSFDPCPDCVAGVRLRVECTAQVDAVVPIFEDDSGLDVEGELASWLTSEHIVTDGVKWLHVYDINDPMGRSSEFIALPPDEDDLTHGRVAVLISDVRYLVDEASCQTSVPVRPFDGLVAELSEVLA